jgi:hypothetical protein
MAMRIQTGTFGGLSELFLFLLVAASFLHIVSTSQLLPLRSIFIKKKKEDVLREA